MLGFDKLAGNARRFRMLMGMSLQEFDLLFAKVEKMYPEEERKRLSKRSRQREIGAGRKFVFECAGANTAASVLLQDIRYPRCGRRGFWSRSGHRIALHRADSACRKEVRAHTGKALRKVQEGTHGRGARGTLPGTRSPRGRIRAADTEAEAEGYGKVPLFGQGWKTYSQDAVHRERSRPDHPQSPGTPQDAYTTSRCTRRSTPRSPRICRAGTVRPGRESARTCGVMATVGIRERRKWIQTSR